MEEETTIHFYNPEVDSDSLEQTYANIHGIKEWLGNGHGDYQSIEASSIRVLINNHEARLFVVLGNAEDIYKREWVENEEEGWKMRVRGRWSVLALSKRER